MGEHRRFDFKCTGFSEYLYRVMVASTPAQIMDVEEGLRKFLKDDRTIHRFCENHPFGKQVIMFSQLGHSIGLIFAPEPHLIDETLVSVMDQYKVPGKRLNVVEGMARNNVFVISDREMVVVAQMGAQNCQTGIYEVSAFTKDLLKKRRGFNDIESYGKMMDRAEDTYAEFNRLALNTNNASEYVNTVLAITDIQLRILQCLFDKRHSAVEIKTIMDMVSLNTEPNLVSKQLKELIGMKLVMDDNTTAKKKYAKTLNFMITAAGIKKVMEYLKYIHTKTYKSEK